MGARGAVATAVALVLAAVLGTGVAQAGGQLIPLEFRGLPEPTFAGERLAWVTGGEAPGELAVHLADQSGADRRTVRVPIARKRGASVDIRLAASSERWALHVAVRHCAGEHACRYGFYRRLYSVVMSAPLGEPFEFVAGCTDAEACKPCAGPTYIDDPDATTLDVAEDTLAYEEPCRDGTVTVRDFGSGAVAGTFENVDTARLAGPFLAANVYPPGDRENHLVVHDLRTGTERYRVPLAGYSNFDFDVQEDGTLAYLRVTKDDGELEWASPEQPFAHPLNVSGELWPVRIARGRIAYGRGGKLGVVALDGTRVADAELPASIRDFDGNRLAYGQQPCTVSAIGVWDLAGKPPELPRDECPAARLTKRTLTGRLAEHRLSVPLECPAQPALGCHGNVIVTGRAPGSRRTEGLARDFLELAPGERRTFEIYMNPRRACRLYRGGGSIRAKLEAEAFTRHRADSHSLRSSIRIKGLRGCRS